MASVPSKFDGQGQLFKAKLIGVENVPASRGDEMTQKALITMKAAVLVAKGHKPKIVLRIARSGVQIIDASNEQVLHDHVVTRISYIARDATDNRAFGYIYTTLDDKFLFIGIKTEKAAEQVVSALSELFNELLELKKKAVADTVTAGGAATAAVVPAPVPAPVPASSAQVAFAPSAQVAVAAGVAGDQLVRDTAARAEPAVLTQGSTVPTVTPLPTAATAGLAAAAYQSGAPSSLLELDSLLPVSQAQPAQQVQLAGYGGAQLPVAAAMPAQPVAAMMHAQPGAWSIAVPPHTSVVAPQPAAAWPAAVPQQQPAMPSMTGSFGGVTASAFGQPFVPAPFQPVLSASTVLPLGAAQPGGGAFNPAWQAPVQLSSTWATAEPFANDPFFSAPSPFPATSTNAAAPLQPQKVQTQQAAPAGGQQWQQQQQNGMFDAFADIDLLGKQGQKPLRKDEFFSDIKSPPKKTLLEIAQQPTTQPASEGTNSGINTRY